MNLELILRGVFLGVGLSADAFAVSMTNGFNQPKADIKKALLIAGAFGVFQGAMPLIGYAVGSAVLGSLEKVLPWVSLVILAFLGGKSIKEGLSKGDCAEVKALTFAVVLGQAVATSLDALSVGFTFADYKFYEAIIASAIIAVETFAICLMGVWIGKKFGDKFGNKAEIFGGIILILIGLEIFITKTFF